jgi:cbb3-type cytochrome oxidase maturation protein
MDILFLLVPLSVVLVALIGVFLFWAIGSGQFEDLEEEGQSIFQHDDLHHQPTQESNV